ncbi:MAG: hypothetical protein K2M97_00735, partial [Muribaculaceae bacterium]|nr:hypothetical protein [Muribaculaceae bacterium]
PWAASRVNQTMSLRGQLDAGYRVLDLRMRYNPASGTYGIAHENRVFGDFNADGLTLIADWLDAHPTEGVIIRTRNEGSVDGWGDGVRDYLLSGPLSDKLIRDFDPEMTVGDLRGRVLVISTDEYSGGPVGARVRWGDATPFGLQPFVTSGGERGTVCFTDRYKRNSYRSPSRADKSADILRVLDSAARRCADGDFSCWHWTWLNVAGLGLGSPAKSTDVYTRLVADYIDRLQAGRYVPVGMVMCDWAGRSRQGTVRCAAAVIDNNFRASASGSWPPRKY